MGNVDVMSILGRDRELLGKKILLEVVVFVN